MMEACEADASIGLVTPPSNNSPNLTLPLLPGRSFLDMNELAERAMRGELWEMGVPYGQRIGRAITRVADNPDPRRFRRAGKRGGYDLTNSSLQSWWLDHCIAMAANAEINGIFIDGNIKVLEPAFLKNEAKPVQAKTSAVLPFFGSTG